MKWLLALIAITTAEHIANPFVSDYATWEIALGAKYFTMAIVFTLLLQNCGGKALLYRSIVAVFCIASWVDAIGHISWQVAAFDSSMPILALSTGWFIYTARRTYDYCGDPVKGGNVYLMLLRPTTVFAVCKALVAFPWRPSVCVLTEQPGATEARQAPLTYTLLMIGG